jgi:predicted metalloprotease with PDZ domain
MNSTNLQPKTTCLELGGMLLLCLLAQTGAANQSSAAQVAQSQNAAQQTNGRGGIGLTCRAEANGCRVGRIIKDGPAERAGLRVDDLLLRLNPSDQAGVVEQIAKNARGTKITVPLQRGSEHLQLPIIVEDQLAVALRGAALGDPAAEDRRRYLPQGSRSVERSRRGPEMDSQRCRTGL